MHQYRASGGQSQGMPDEGAGEERHAGLGDRLVAKVPDTSVKGVQVLAAARNQANWESATDNLAVGRDVGTNAKDCLCSPGVAAESRDELVKHECCV